MDQQQQQQTPHTSLRTHRSKSQIVSSAAENDVLLGRGNQINNRKGNSQYRSFVKERATEYWFCPDKLRKDAIAREVIQKIRDTGGRFLKPISAETPNGEWKQIFEVVDESSILGKTKQALRDTAAAKRLDGTSEQVARGSRGMVGVMESNNSSSSGKQHQHQQPMTNLMETSAAAAAATRLGAAGQLQLDPTAQFLSSMGASAAGSTVGWDALERYRALQSLAAAGTMHQQQQQHHHQQQQTSSPYASAANAPLHSDPAYLLPAQVELERDRFRIAQMQRAMINEKLFQGANAAQQQQQQQQRSPNTTTATSTTSSNPQQTMFPGTSGLFGLNDPHNMLQLQLLQQQQQQQQLLLRQALLGSGAGAAGPTGMEQALLQLQQQQQQLQQQQQQHGDVVSQQQQQQQDTILALLQQQQQQQQQLKQPEEANTFAPEVASKPTSTVPPSEAPPPHIKQEEEQGPHDDQDDGNDNTTEADYQGKEDDDDEETSSEEEEEELVGLAARKQRSI